jgi:hypothetical protein
VSHFFVSCGKMCRCVQGVAKVVAIAKHVHSRTAVGTIGRMNDKWVFTPTVTEANARIQIDARACSVVLWCHLLVSLKQFWFLSFGVVILYWHSRWLLVRVCAEMPMHCCPRMSTRLSIRWTSIVKSVQGEFPQWFRLFVTITSLLCMCVFCFLI